MPRFAPLVKIARQNWRHGVLNGDTFDEARIAGRLSAQRQLIYIHHSMIFT
jgi:hypothetical protein